MRKNKYHHKFGKGGKALTGMKILTEKMSRFFYLGIITVFSYLYIYFDKLVLSNPLGTNPQGLSINGQIVSYSLIFEILMVVVTGIYLLKTLDYTGMFFGIVIMLIAFVICHQYLYG